MIPRLVMDIGGSFIKYGLVDEAGLLLPGSVGKMETSVSGVFAEIRSLVEGIKVAPQVALCLPGPFDYTDGIFLMRHKFASLYGLSLTPLFHELGKQPLYVHDSTAFLLGEGDGNCAGIMLGTGFGFALAQGGRVCIGQDQRPAIPLWNKPFRDGIAEDYVSRRAIGALYRQVSRCLDDPDVKEINERAQAGDMAARDTFQKTAEAIAAVLDRYVPRSLYHGRIVLGGQIAHAGAFLIPRLRQAGLEVRQAAHIDEASLYGLGKVLRYGKEACVMVTTEKALVQDKGCC